MKIILYYANWCPHCKQYLSEWNNIKKNLNINFIYFLYSTHKNEIIEADI